LAAVIPQRRQADVFRAGLLAAARRGEPFNMATGELVSRQRDEPGTGRYRVRVRRLRRYEVEDVAISGSALFMSSR
jgi:hypothetical protein